jgi:mycofactocin system transcriptional regulator
VHGFDNTTVDEIAAAAGISRRTFFRYFGSKNDVVWGRFDEGLRGLRLALSRAPAKESMRSVLRREIVAFNTVPADQLDLHRNRMRLILTVPDLQAHSTLRFAAWRMVVAEFVAKRTGSRPTGLLPRLGGHLLLGAAVAAYEQWLAGGGALADLLDASLAQAVRALPAG